MKKFGFGLIALMALIGLLFALSPATVAQQDPWYRPLSPYGSSAGVTYGTVAPSIASIGQNPAQGELWVHTDGAADGGQALFVWNSVAATWESMGQEVVVGTSIYDWQAHTYGADTYIPLAIPDGQMATGYYSIPPLFTHTEDVTMTVGANERLIVMRQFVANPVTISDAAVILVDGGAIAAGDIVGIAVYEDADAGVQLSTGTGDGTAAGLEEVALTDVTLYPGFYRFGICTSDDTNMNFAGTLLDDEHIDIISGIAGDIAFGSGANPCVVGVPPATTGALTTQNEAIPFIYFY